MPSSSRRRRRRRRKKKPPTLSASEARDWASLPRDILVDVFLRLGPCSEIMRGAELACTAWRRVAVEEPLLWRRIDIAMPLRWPWIGPRAMAMQRNRAMAVRAAADRSAGQCEAFFGNGDDESLLYLAERSPLLKILHLSDGNIGNEILQTVLKKLSLLEDLDISTLDAFTYDANLFAYVCQTCPHLRKLRLALINDHSTVELFEPVRGQGPCEISVMCELRSLELFGFDLTNAGLAAILDNCPVLESLHITGCFNDVKMSEELRLKCARVKNLDLPVDDDEEEWGPYYSSDDEFYY